MGSGTDNSLQIRAIEWHVRLRDGDDATWEAFAGWLAQDPRHGRAYEAVEQMDLALEPLLPQLVLTDSTPAVDSPVAGPAAKSRRAWLVGLTLAASIAAGIAFLPQLTPSRYEVTTGPGQHQTVRLDTTTEILLNGSTRLTLDRKNPRYALLSSGEALFRVRHDAAQPFTLEVGGNRIQDVGTVFDVVREASELRVAVAEGQVVYHTRSNAVSLHAGQALSDRSGSGELRVIPTPVASVGAWESGHLVYSGEPLSRVAVDLGRALGITVVVAPSIAERPFSGAIVLSGSGPEQVKRLGVALSVNLQAEATGWTMKPLDDSGR
jgi:transmembrane sensor